MEKEGKSMNLQIDDGNANRERKEMNAFCKLMIYMGMQTEKVGHFHKYTEMEGVPL